MRANTNNHQNLAQKTANFLPYRVVVLGVSVSTCIKIQRFFRSNFSRTYNVNKLVDVRLCWSDITKFVYIVSPSEIWLEEPLKIQKWTNRISENKDSSRLYCSYAFLRKWEVSEVRSSEVGFRHCGQYF